MTPGTFLFDNKFKFKDGKTGEKIFVVLNNGACGYYLAIKTTSRGDRYGIQHGCQVLDRFPNFHYVKGSCFLSKNTWVQLDSFFEFEKSKLIQNVINGEIRNIGVLLTIHTIELLTCVSHAEDLSGAQEKIVLETIQTLKEVESEATAC